VKTSTSLAFLPVLIAVGSSAQEMAINPKIESVGLFKNGLSIVRASFEAKAAGAYLWADPPRCVHGTFIVNSEGGVSLQSGTRTVEEVFANDRPTGHLQSDLGGQQVRVRLRGPQSGTETEIVGRVLQLPVPPPTPRLWSHTIAGETPGYLEAAQSARGWQPSTGNYLIVEAEQKRVYVDMSQIVSVEVAGAPPERKRTVEKPVMIFSAAKAGLVRISYLTRGASWVPSYQVDLGTPKMLRLSQTALVRNELSPWQNVQLQLISGFPNVKFGHVDSPLWPGTTMANFFSQIARDPRAGGGPATQQVAYNSARFTEALPPQMPEEGNQSEDLHFEDIGERSLSPGETLSLDVASGTAAYERVVEWTSPDPRGANGRSYDQRALGDDEQPWDAVLFQNPLKIPMTTAAATVTEKGQFRGQSMSEWTNPGQRTCLKITRALSIQADRQEIEEPGKRESTLIGSDQYYRATIRGTLTMRNYRSQPAVLLSRAQFSGELLSAEEKPMKTLRPEGIFSVNPRHELEWKLTLAPGEEKKVAYSYAVLVRN
jgi:hypothetical protein